jgi:hypothetical protein
LSARRDEDYPNYEAIYSANGANNKNNGNANVIEDDNDCGGGSGDNSGDVNCFGSNSNNNDHDYDNGNGRGNGTSSYSNVHHGSDRCNDNHGHGNGNDNGIGDHGDKCSERSRPKEVSTAPGEVVSNDDHHTSSRRSFLGEIEDKLLTTTQNKDSSLMLLKDKPIIKIRSEGSDYDSGGSGGGSRDSRPSSGGMNSSKMLRFGLPFVNSKVKVYESADNNEYPSSQEREHHSGNISGHFHVNLVSSMHSLNETTLFVSELAAAHNAENTAEEEEAFDIETGGRNSEP